MYFVSVNVCLFLVSFHLVFCVPVETTLNMGKVLYSNTLNSPSLSCIAAWQARSYPPPPDFSPLDNGCLLSVIYWPVIIKTHTKYSIWRRTVTKIRTKTETLWKQALFFGWHRTIRGRFVLIQIHLYGFSLYLLQNGWKSSLWSSPGRGRQETKQKETVAGVYACFNGRS